MKTVYYISILILLITILGYLEFGNKTMPTANYSRIDMTNDSNNLLTNSHFESGKATATNWSEEYDTTGIPIYSLSTNGATDGSKAQQIIYHGRAEDDGRKKVEIFQCPIKGMVAGNKLKFSAYMSGTLINTPTVIGIEGFNNPDGVGWINETDSYITDLSGTPKCYEVTYTCPADTKCVAVYLQCQEIGPNSEISIALDNAQLTIQPQECTGINKNTESKSANWLSKSANWLSKSANWLILTVLLFIPTMVIVSEVIVCIRNSMQAYTFSNVNELDYQILVPIWGDIRYLENVGYLSKYNSKVVLCTTGNGTDEFYTSLNVLADKYGFQIFKDEPDNCFERSNKRTTSGSMRDTIIKNALKTVKTFFVVTLDADSTTTLDISYLVGELEQRNLDIASIRLVLNNANVSILTRLQAFEYDVAMNFRYFCPWLISGACHVAKTNVLENVMNRHSLFFQGNDVETGLIAKTLGYKVGHIPFIVLTDVPDNFRSWFRQRLAWSGGEFRLYVMNFKFIIRHPFFWFYGAIVTICLFPLRWYALFTLSYRLCFILAVYVGLVFYLHWNKKNACVLLMPLYTLFLSLVMTPLGILWYFKMAHKDKNYGIIKSSRN